MKTSYRWAVVAVVVGMVNGRAQEGALLSEVNAALVDAAAQTSGLLARLEGRTGLPRTWQNNQLTLVGATDWTCGFFPGELWLLYEATGELRWREAAVGTMSQVEVAKNNRGTHDVGFILSCSFGQAYRLTGSAAYRDVLTTGATSLSTRFNPTVGAIRSWDWGTWKYPVIIDNLMNLELLVRSSRLGGPANHALQAVSHAERTRVNHFRADASSWHVVDYEPSTGEVRSKGTHQGYAAGSSWARGQAWGLYGYTLMARETGRPEFLDLANRIARFVATHPRLPADKVPYWDFDAPDIPTAPRDSSAAAVMASALIELADLTGGEEGKQHLVLAEQQLRSLMSPAYRAARGQAGDFLLLHATGNRPAGTEVDVPLVYGDYYYLEALLRYRARFADPGRMINLSSRAWVGPGDQLLVSGLIVGGGSSRTVLLRALGPALAGFGVAGTLADPRLRLFRGPDLVAENDDWLGDPSVSAAAQQAGAFAISDPASRDAALLLTLPPGAYTAQVSGAAGATGTVLLEAYEVPSR
ncbi:MAG: glycoside hydrolase family 88 protein [Opitutaceae bacterium]